MQKYLKHHVKCTWIEKARWSATAWCKTQFFLDMFLNLKNIMIMINSFYFLKVLWVGYSYR